MWTKFETIRRSQVSYGHVKICSNSSFASNIFSHLHASKCFCFVSAFVCCHLRASSLRIRARGMDAAFGEGRKSLGRDSLSSLGERFAAVGYTFVPLYRELRFKNSKLTMPHSTRTYFLWLATHFLASASLLWW